MTTYDVGPYIGRLSYNDIGRPLLEVIDDGDEVLLKEGDAFFTFMTPSPIPGIGIPGKTQ